MKFLKVTFKDYATLFACSKPSLFLVISWDMNLDQMCAIRDATNLRLADPVCVFAICRPFLQVLIATAFIIMFI